MAASAIWNYLALVLQLAGTLGLTAIAFRSLGSGEVGLFSLAAVTVGLVSILDPAAGFAMARTVAEVDAGRLSHSEPEAALLPELHAGLRTLAAGLVIVGGVGVVFAWALPASHPSTSELVMVSAVVLAAAVQLTTAVLPAASLGLGDYRGLCAASAVTAVINVLVTWAFVHHIGVAALGLALLAGQLGGRGCLAVRRRTYTWVRSPRRPMGLGAVRHLWHRSGSLFLSSFAAQVLPLSDLWIVGLARGTGSTAAYRAGSMIPTQASGLFYRVYDVIYPRLPRIEERADQERAVALGTRVFCAAAGCLFAALFVERGPLVALLTGASSSLSESVFALFCLIWLVNVPAHGISLLLIARGQQATMTPVLLVEAMANVAVSAVLVVRFGPLGAAVGTLATMAISNLIVLPKVLAPVLPKALTVTWIGVACAVFGVALGAAVETPAALGLSGSVEATVVALLAVSAAAVAAWIVAGQQGRQVLRVHL